MADRPPRRHADDEPMGTVPPLAGISDYPAAARDGVSVDETVTMFAVSLGSSGGRCSCWPRTSRGARVGGQVRAVAPSLAGRRALRLAGERVPELRKPPHDLDRPDDPALEAFFEELVRSRTTRELLTGVYRVLKPSLLEAVDAHRRGANPLADQPTFRLLRFLALEEQEQLDWGAAALAALGGPDEEWERHLRAYLDAAGGAEGSGVRAEELPAPRSAEPLELVRLPRRDERFPRLWDSRGRIPYDERPHDEVNWRMLYVRLTEMHAVELVALTLFEWPDASFDVHRDLAAISGTRHATRCSARRGSRPAAPTGSRCRTTLASPRIPTPSSSRRSATRCSMPPSGWDAEPASGLSTRRPPRRATPWRCRPGLRLGGRGLARPPRAARAADARRGTTKELDETGEHIWEVFDRIPEVDRALPRSDWWDEFYAGIRAQPDVS